VWAEVTLVEVDIDVESLETDDGVPVALVKCVWVEPPDPLLTGDTPVEREPADVIELLIVVISISPASKLRPLENESVLPKGPG
jgi:hypothetical protein